MLRLRMTAGNNLHRVPKQVPFATDTEIPYIIAKDTRHTATVFPRQGPATGGPQPPANSDFFRYLKISEFHFLSF